MPPPFVPATRLDRVDFGGDFAGDFTPDFADAFRFELDGVALVVLVVAGLSGWAAGADSLPSSKAEAPPRGESADRASTSLGFVLGAGSAGVATPIVASPRGGCDGLSSSRSIAPVPDGAAVPSLGIAGPGAFEEPSGLRVCQYAKNAEGAAMTTSKTINACTNRRGDRRAAGTLGALTSVTGSAATWTNAESTPASGRGNAASQAWQRVATALLIALQNLQGRRWSGEPHSLQYFDPVGFPCAQKKHEAAKNPFAAPLIRSSMPRTEVVCALSDCRGASRVQMD